ncbi:Asp-tRNA(Asn)/Glu-tRNA(Gln) amidotransferase GatCAB subunit C [bacterium (Candidatus Gribaldobacteria) CG_4_10_14_0_8_um_filter_33_9]|uniref:Asp-tRNA(Asn)/Glu-tRNA(Gln) amidotransferase GatCAB subunit C n=1 Tax=bacterium (Candidatus Gribaldobacteria) CG_4_10_14_0_8_um_filter_33_9 TaxID=2014266 RepID=A0A2M7RNY5_9BACT|nr:MAG: Asp-tRNA(Asn)/Glu-tRNA(Gln) amidotransferase GatCAB subunit C [bacterium (Candidatus Gribaldobacteria) CG_4_10_14_0_8_um_filter_33_9]
MISKNEVERIAKLARITLSDKEKEKMRSELSMVLDYFKLLEGIDTSITSPTLYPFLLKNITREDGEKKESLEKVKKLMDAAIEKEKGYVRVKAVF